MGYKGVLLNPCFVKVPSGTLRGHITFYFHGSPNWVLQKNAINKRCDIPYFKVDC